MPAKAVLIVDQRANAAQRAVLVRMAKQSGRRTARSRNSGTVGADPRLDACACKNNACADLDAAVARLKTRCIDASTTSVRQQNRILPPLSTGVRVVPPPPSSTSSAAPASARPGATATAAAPIRDIRSQVNGLRKRMWFTFSARRPSAKREPHPFV